MFWSKVCKSSWNCEWNLAFPVFVSPIVWNMCENLPYESLYFKELYNQQEYYWPTIYRTGAAVVSTITSYKITKIVRTLSLAGLGLVNMVITQARIWKTFWVQNSTSLLYLPIPLSAETWKIVTKEVCQFFFSLKLTISTRKSVFWYVFPYLENTYH